MMTISEFLLATSTDYLRQAEEARKAGDMTWSRRMLMRHIETRERGRQLAKRARGTSPRTRTATP